MKDRRTTSTRTGRWVGATVATTLVLLGLAACSDEQPRGPLTCTVAGFDFAGDGVDQDCDGTIDNQLVCDTGGDLDSTDPAEAARAAGICATPTGATDWGLVSAAWVQADGSPIPTDPGQAAAFHLGHGLLADFGANVSVVEGERMLALSTGTARDPGDADYSSPMGFDKGFVGGYPEGFPTTAAGCSDPLTPHDAAGLEVTLRVPPNASGLSFRIKYHAWDHPAFVCTGSVDQFVAMLTTAGSSSPSNVAVDINGAPIDVNAENVITVCDGCVDGTSALQGTGFEDHGASGWIPVTASVAPGTEVTLRLAIYDSGDGVSDATVLIDDFVWSGS